MVFWAFSKQNSTLNRRKQVKNRQTGMWNSFLEKVPHNSDFNKGGNYECKRQIN